MDAIEAMHRRQSTLRYLSRPVEREKLAMILEAGITAPSPLNLQPWAFVVVTDPELTRQLAHYMVQMQVEVVYGGLMGMAADFTGRMLSLYTQLDQAPCFILACLQPKTNFASPSYEPYLRDWYLMSIGAAVQNMMIAATSLGLGSRWFTGFALDAEGQALMKRLFQIPDEVEVVAATPLGYYDEPSKERPEQQLAALAEFQPGQGPALARLFSGRLPVQEVLHENHW